MNYILENEELKVTVRSKSAEMISIVKKESGAEYLWNGDPAYWGWSSPILFPLVGNVRDKKYSYHGKTYDMKQHGFARNQEFALVSQTEKEIWFSISDTEETRAQYPFAFLLEAGYRLEGGTVTVLWRVTNTGGETLHFSIGAHPAFLCPIDGEGEQQDYYMGFDTEAPQISYKLIDEATGLIDPREYPLALDKGYHRIERDRFDLDALIIEHRQARKMWLAKPDKTPYVCVEFDAPLFGVWSPAKKNAPFICIEPWYGRSDALDFHGTLEEREYANQAQPGEVFERSYRIHIL